MPFVKPVRLTAGITYDPNKGIYNDTALTASDVGNVLPASESGARPTPSRVPPETEGKMNSGLRDFVGEPNNPPTLKPLPGDVDKLAEYYAVGVRTVERWFDIADSNGRREPRNCVPVNVLGKTVDSLTDRQQRRVFLAACLAVDGGLKQDPVYTKGDKQGKPYECRSHETSLANCVRTIRNVFNGNVRLDDIDLGRAWVQMTIVSTSPSGWDVVLLMFYPAEGQS